MVLTSPLSCELATREGGREGRGEREKGKERGYIARWSPLNWWTFFPP